MKKIISICLTLLLVLSLCSCKKEESYTGPEIKLTLFYSDTCRNCHNFITEAIPALEKEFGESLIVQSFETGSIENIQKYTEIADQLEDFDPIILQEVLVPFIVFEGLFAKVGYDSGTVQYYIDDVKRAVKGEKLDTFLDVTNDRFFFKES